MGLKWEAGGLQFLNGMSVLKPPWGYGMAYKPANRLVVVYYPIPLNYVIRWARKGYLWVRWQIAWHSTRFAIWLIRLFTPNFKIR